MRRFNNIIQTQQDYTEIFNYLKYKQIPNDVKDKARFRKKCDEFQIKENKMFFKPLNLEVVPRESSEDRLNQLLKNDPNTIGKSINSLYKYLQSKYIGFTRADIQYFLSKQSNYQMLKQDVKRTNLPITADYPNELWSIDLIDMNAFNNNNSRYLYVFTIIDVFSRYVFLLKLKSKESKEVAEQLSNLINTIGIKPDKILSDLGGEFKDEFSEYCEDQNIRQIFTRSYSPQSNGITERVNKEIRKLIRAYLLEQQNLKWVDVLKKVETNINNSYQSTIKAFPDDVWEPNKIKPSKRLVPRTINQKQKNLVRLSILERNKQLEKQFKEEDTFQVGDIVRVKMSTIFSSIRRQIKANEKKNLIVFYTPDLFEIEKVISSRKGKIERKKYLLTNADDQYVTDKNGKAHRFYATDLLLFNGDENTAELDMEQALKLNKVEPTENDLSY